MDDQYGTVCCIIITWRLELYHYHIEYAYKRNEHDPFAFDDLGLVLHSGIGRIIIPCIIIRLLFYYCLIVTWVQVFT